VAVVVVCVVVTVVVKVVVRVRKKTVLRVAENWFPMIDDQVRSRVQRSNKPLALGLK